MSKRIAQVSAKKADKRSVKLRILLSFIAIILCASFNSFALTKTLNYQGRLTDSARSPLTDGKYTVLVCMYSSANGTAFTAVDIQNGNNTPANNSFNTAAIRNNCQELTSVTFTDGLFSTSITLDSGSNYTDTTNINTAISNGEDLYVEISYYQDVNGNGAVNAGDTNLTTFPKQKISTAPIALMVADMGVRGKSLIESDDTPLDCTGYLQVTGAGKFTCASSIASSDIADGAVTSAKIANGTIDGQDLASNFTVSTSLTVSSSSGNILNVDSSTGKVAVGSNGVTMTSSGYISASRISGDGSLLTNVAASTLGGASLSSLFQLGTDNTASGNNTFTGAINYFSGKLGISSASPTAKLDVVGGSTTSAAISTQGYTLVNNGAGSATTSLKVSGSVYINGTTVADSYKEAGEPIVFFSKNGNHAYYNLGNIGIGTTSPGVKLEIEAGSTSSRAISANGSVNVSGTLYVDSLTVGSTSLDNSYINTSGDAMSGALGLVATVGGPGVSLYASGDTTTGLESQTTNQIDFVVGGNYLANFDSNGNFKIGAVSSSIKISITSSGNISASYWQGDGTSITNVNATTISGASSSSLLVLAANNTATGSNTLSGTNVFTGTVGIGNPGPYAKLDVTSGSTSSGAISTTGYARINQGASSSTLSLAVSGNANVSGQVIADSFAVSGGKEVGMWTKSGSTINYPVGNVGIGTTNPGYLFHLNPTISSSSNVTGVSVNVVDGNTSSSAGTKKIGVEVIASTYDNTDNYYATGVSISMAGTNIKNAYGMYLQGIGTNGIGAAFIGPFDNAFYTTDGSSYAAGTYALYGYSSSYSGVSGLSTGVWADATVNGTYGAYGNANGSSAYAMYGYGTSYGVYASGGQNFISGAVGIGNLGPYAKLDVAGGSTTSSAISTQGIVYINNGASSTTHSLNVSGSVRISGTLYADNYYTGSGSTFEATYLNTAGDAMTGALGLAAGSSSLPSLYFSGYTGTGIYSPGADTVAISTNGTERLRITSTGNVGIGTTAPTARLEISASGAASPALYSGGTMAINNKASSATTSLVVSGSTYVSGTLIADSFAVSNGSTAGMWIKGSANKIFYSTLTGTTYSPLALVGIGSSNPTASLEVSSAGSNAISATSGSSYGIRANAVGTGVGIGIYGKTINGAYGVMGDGGSTAGSYGVYGNGGTYGLYSYNNNSTGWGFWVTSGNSFFQGGVSGMNGNVGIGTSTVTNAQLNIYKSASLASPYTPTGATIYTENTHTNGSSTTGLDLTVNSYEDYNTSNAYGIKSYAFNYGNCDDFAGPSYGAYFYTSGQNTNACSTGTYGVYAYSPHIGGFALAGYSGSGAGTPTATYASGTGYGAYIYDNKSTGIALYSWNSQGASYYSMYSTGAKNYFAGNVGIGATSPTHALEVNGDVQISGTLTQNIREWAFWDFSGMSTLDTSDSWMGWYNGAAGHYYLADVGLRIDTVNASSYTGMSSKRYWYRTDEPSVTFNILTDPAIYSGNWYSTGVTLGFTTSTNGSYGAGTYQYYMDIGNDANRNLCLGYGNSGTLTGITNSGTDGNGCIASGWALNTNYFVRVNLLRAGGAVMQLSTDGISWTTKASTTTSLGNDTTQWRVWIFSFNGSNAAGPASGATHIRTIEVKTD